MFEWLLRRLRYNPVPSIRTIDDLTAAIKSGAIKPHVYREGEVQVADLFAETGLSLRERKKVMLRSCQVPAGIRMYVHRHCSEAYLQRLPGDRAIFAADTEQWSPADLIGLYRDVTHCDQCGQEFVATDEGYIAYWVTTKEELELLDEVLREPAQSPKKTEVD